VDFWEALSQHDCEGGHIQENSVFLGKIGMKKEYEEGAELAICC